MVLQITIPRESIFHQLTDGFFYAYQNIDFIRQFRANPFHPDIVITDIAELVATQNKMRIVTNIFWDLYVPFGTPRNDIFQILVRTIQQCIDTMTTIRDFPDPQALAIENCRFYRLDDSTMIILFPDSFYKSARKETYYTVLQYRDYVCPLYNLQFDLQRLIDYDDQIPFFYREESRSFVYLIKTNSAPYSKVRILQNLYSCTTMLDVARQIMMNAQAFPQNYPLKLPKKFRARTADNASVFSTKKYQQFIADFMIQNAGLLCWHDAGTGKTLTSIMTIIALLRRDPTKHVIIVCPASLKQQWEEVIRDHIVPPPIYSYLERMQQCLLIQDRIRVISYQTLNSTLMKWIVHTRGDITSDRTFFFQSLFGRENIQECYAVFDEIHEVSNDYVQIKKIDYLRSIIPELARITKIEQPTGNYWIRLFLTCFVQKVLFLTATPIQNSVKDLRPILQNIMIVYMKHTHQLSDIDDVLFWRNGFMKRWRMMTTTPIKLDNALFEKSPRLPDTYKEDLFSTPIRLTNPLSGDDWMRISQACANFRGMIHRVRASVPGRGVQKDRQVQQKDAFPQEVLQVHKIPVRSDSVYLKEYKHLIDEKVLSKDLKDNRVEFSDLVYHQSTSLYTNQREASTCIYEIIRPTTRFDRTHPSLTLSFPFSFIKQEKGFVRLSVKNDLQGFKKVIIDEEQFDISTVNPEYIDIVNSKNLPVQFFRRHSVLKVERPSFVSRTSVSSRFTLPFPVTVSGQKLQISSQTQTKILDPTKNVHFTIEKNDLVRAGKQYFTVTDVGKHTIHLDRPAPGDTKQIEILKPFQLEVTEWEKTSPHTIRISRNNSHLSTSADDLIIRIDEKQFLPVKTIRQDTNHDFILQTTDRLPDKIPSVKLLSFKLTDRTTFSTIRPNLDTDHPKKARFIVTSSYEKISPNRMKIRKDVIPFMKNRLNNDISLEMDKKKYRVIGMEEHGTDYVMEVKPALPVSGTTWTVIFDRHTYICSPKIDFLRGLIPDESGVYMDISRSNQKVVIFMAFLRNVDIVQQMMKQPFFFARKKKGLILSLDTDDPVKRNQIVQRFRSEKGNVILLITKKSATGLDLRGVTDIIFMDLVWTASLYYQIIGRGIRFYSHSHLDLSERRVNIHVLLLQSDEVKFVDDLMWNKVLHKEWIQTNVDYVLLYAPQPLIDQNPPIGEKSLGGLLLHNPPSLTMKRPRQQQRQQRLSKKHK